MSKEKLLLIGDHFILPSVMREALGPLADRFDIHEAQTPFPLEPFRNIAEVREASGSEEMMIRELEGVSLCIAHHAPLTRKVIEASPALRLFIVCRGGPVNVNLDAASQHGISIAYTPARNAAATAEHTIAMMMCAIRKIATRSAELRKGQWNGDYTWETAAFELESATVGLIGYGAIGRIVGRILRSFGAKVLVYDPFAHIGSEDVEQVAELNTLLDQVDVVSLHARETAETRSILGAAQIGRLKRGAVVVNCARGSLMDYNALGAALLSGHLSAAAADVFPQEPLLADSPLLKLPNFVMTPHIAGGTRQAAIKAARIAADELQRYITGEPLHHCANPK
ncbi:NAD(P)-dependent oxidoreductase [Terriglobus sp. ADX1]|uniref:NAD(P)-dependent oxidoreductase n=1 Tax=Terriglobus sp. ADX1 TaxID=2794063 RepID=UPI002FE67864